MTAPAAKRLLISLQIGHPFNLVQEFAVLLQVVAEPACEVVRRQSGRRCTTYTGINGVRGFTWLLKSRVLLDNHEPRHDSTN